MNGVGSDPLASMASGRRRARTRCRDTSFRTMLPRMARARAKLSVEEAPQSTAALYTKFYERDLARLQVELVKQQEYIRAQVLRVVLIFEGCDAAGKGGAIQRITETLNPRAARVVALAAPTAREKG